MKRGMSETAAKHAFSQDVGLRRIIMRDDLRQRKAEHMVRMAKYKKERAKYDEWLEEQRTYAEARALLNLPPAAAPGAAAEGGDGGGGGEEGPLSPGGTTIMKAPPKPVFTLFGPAGHFKTLAERLAKRKEAEFREKQKEWARQDSMRMEALNAELEDKEKAVKEANKERAQAQILRKQSTKGPLPGAGGGEGSPPKGGGAEGGSKGGSPSMERPKKIAEEQGEPGQPELS